MRSTANKTQRLITHEEREWTATQVKVRITKGVSFQV